MCWYFFQNIDILLSTSYGLIGLHVPLLDATKILLPSSLWMDFVMIRFPLTTGISCRPHRTQPWTTIATWTGWRKWTIASGHLFQPRTFRKAFGIVSCEGDIFKQMLAPKKDIFLCKHEQLLSTISINQGHSVRLFQMIFLHSELWGGLLLQAIFSN